ncbi:MAG: lipopolysaccharide kinase InaA family protein [Victivallaceae bacterium]|nr:lipopolysaccharide kinase InaA family protein [Victivallaceae bacterium]
MTVEVKTMEDFPALRAGGFVAFAGGFYAEGLPAGRVDELCGLCVGGFSDRSALIKDSRGTTAGIADSGVGKVFVKIFNAYSWQRRLRRFFVTPRPFIALRATERLQMIVPVPELLLALRLGRETHAIVTRAYSSPLIAAEQPEYVAGNIGIFAGDLAKTINRMHAAGVYHGDLKFHNILLRTMADGGCKTGVFDFDGTRFMTGPVDGRRRCREWARIISSCIRLGIGDFREEFIAAAGGLDRGLLNVELDRFFVKEAGKK